MKIPARGILPKVPGIQSLEIQQTGRAHPMKGPLTGPVQPEIMEGLTADQVLADLLVADIPVADLKAEQVQVGMQEEVLPANRTRKLTDDLITN